MIVDPFQCCVVLSELICAFSQAQLWEKAEKKWNEVMLIFDSNENTDDKIWKMVKLGKKLGQVKQWEQTSLIVTGMTALFSVIEDWGMAKIEREEVPAQAQQWERELVQPGVSSCQRERQRKGRESIR